MSPFPEDPVRARGPMRFVVSTYPSPGAAVSAIEACLARRLAACGSQLPVESRYWWGGHLETATETLVLFKTVPKRVGALLRWLKENHPYEVPEIAEVDVPRADPGYLTYLSRTLDRAALAVPPKRRATRRAARRSRGAPAPGRTRGTRPHRSR